jgi:serine protease Do
MFDRALHAIVVAGVLLSPVAAAQHGQPSPNSSGHSVLDAGAVFGSVNLDSFPTSVPAGMQEKGERHSAELFRDHAYLGVMLEEVDAAKRKELGLDGTPGAFVARVMPGSPASRDGLRDGDLITAFDGKPVASSEALRELLKASKVEQSVRLDVIRERKKVNVTVTLGRAAGHLPFGQFEQMIPGEPFGLFFGQRARLGVSLVTLTDQLRDYFGVESGTGVLVSSVESDGAAAKSGIKAGDVIVSVGQTHVTSVRDVVGELQKLEPGTHSLEVTVVRDRSRQTITVTVEVPEKRDEQTSGHYRT